MQVHLLRHGTAEDISAEGSDAKRKLTGGGRDEVRRAAECARRAKIAPTLILSSPFVRAIETAEIAAEVLAYHSAGIDANRRALIPSASPQRVWNEIRDRHDAMRVLLAGHEPLLSHLAAYLLNSPALRIDMRKASFVRIDLDLLAPNPSGVLKWMATPDICPG